MNPLINAEIAAQRLEQLTPNGAAKRRARLPARRTTLFYPRSGPGWER